MKTVFTLAICSLMCLPFAKADDEVTADSNADQQQMRPGRPQPGRPEQGRPQPGRPGPVRPNRPEYQRPPSYGDHYRDRQGHEVNVGNVIARVIIGAIGADNLDRDHYRRGYNGRVQCYAQNRRGQIYKAAGARPYSVQQKALNKCYNRSYECRPMGCRTERW